MNFLLVDICMRHIPQGHRVWVDVQNTQKHNVMPRLEKILTANGLGCGILDAGDVDPTERNEEPEKAPELTSQMRRSIRPKHAAPESGKSIEFGSPPVEQVENAGPQNQGQAAGESR